MDIYIHLNINKKFNSIEELKNFSSSGIDTENIYLKCQFEDIKRISNDRIFYVQVFYHDIRKKVYLRDTRYDWSHDAWGMVSPQCYLEEYESIEELEVDIKDLLIDNNVLDDKEEKVDHPYIQVDAKDAIEIMAEVLWQEREEQLTKIKKNNE